MPTVLDLLTFSYAGRYTTKKNPQWKISQQPGDVFSQTQLNILIQLDSTESVTEGCMINVC